jgi:hypothetical protein
MTAATVSSPGDLDSDASARIGPYRTSSQSQLTSPIRRDARAATDHEGPDIPFLSIESRADGQSLQVETQLSLQVEFHGRQWADVTVPRCKAAAVGPPAGLAGPGEPASETQL